VDNSGKSSLLKLFYELRNLSTSISRSDGQFLQAVQTDRGIVAFNPADSVHDNAELFCNANSSDIALKFEANYDLNGEYCDSVSPERIVLTIPSDTNTYRAQMLPDGKIPDTKSEVGMSREGTSTLRTSARLIDVD